MSPAEPLGVRRSVSICEVLVGRQPVVGLRDREGF